MRSHLSLAFLLLSLPLWPQRNVAGAIKLKLDLDRFANTGRVLMIAAHPDDENTALLAYLARGRHVRTAYLSLNRGEGGQNLIGSERGFEIGLIRTQELLAARKIDGGEQFFTRSIDFGFSKTTDETLQIWGKEAILADMVLVIRKFQPDVIVNRFSGTQRDGHGNHQVSAMLSKEAFRAAADPTRFPEQLKTVQPWQAKRLFWNYFNFANMEERPAGTTVAMDLGQYDPLLGYSYSEIAGMSRTMHKSQAMGTAERKGSFNQFLFLLDGEKASADIMEGVDTAWSRYTGGAAVVAALEKARAAYDPEDGTKVVPALVEARALVAALPDPAARARLNELDELIANAAGIWADATVPRYALVPGESVTARVAYVARTSVPVRILSASIQGKSLVANPEPLAPNKLAFAEGPLAVSPSHPVSQPYWLVRPGQSGAYRIDDIDQLGLPENPPPFHAEFRFELAGAVLTLQRPVMHRVIDRIDGEKARVAVVVPPVSVSLSDELLVFPQPGKRSLQVLARANRPNLTGTIRLRLPSGWTATPASVPLRIQDEGETQAATFQVESPAGAAEGAAQAEIEIGGQLYQQTERQILYPHIAPILYFTPAQTKLLRTDIQLTAKRVGYVMGSGDDVPDALRQLGAAVTLLEPADLATGDLSRFDAIVTGVRAFNRRPDLRANLPRLLDFVRQGGTLVAQYNTMDDGYGREDTKAGPYPFALSRERVTVESAPVQFTASPLLETPNRVSQQDFDGWVQERGLYFPSRVDPRYQTLFTMNDPGENPTRTATIYAPFGKGLYIYTSLAFFRQLPEGVPGALKLFANFLSAKAAPQGN
jgi:LmbE family N-acetylglucosaminyl deacetylase